MEMGIELISFFIFSSKTVKNWETLFLSETKIVCSHTNQAQHDVQNTQAQVWQENHGG